LTSDPAAATAVFYYKQADGLVTVGMSHGDNPPVVGSVIESVSFKGPSATIKTHHNVGGLTGSKPARGE
jgi:hypothetical protein